MTTRQFVLALKWSVMSEDQRIPTLVQVVSTAWATAVDDGRLSEQTREKFSALATRFAVFAIACGVESIHDIDDALCRAFIHAPGKDRSGEHVRPAVATMHGRRAVLRSLFATARTMGIGLDDPTQSIELPDRGRPSGCRPLTGDEAEQVQFFADRGPDKRHFVMIALLLAGAHTAEVGWMTVTDLDLAAGTARVHGSVKYAPRTVALRSQDLPWLRARAGHLADDDAMLCDPLGGTAAARQARIGMSVGAVLRDAGLGNEPGITPTSLTAYAARRAFETRRNIEDAARVSGCRSLDSAATLIDYQWQD